MKLELTLDELDALIYAALDENPPPDIQALKTAFNNLLNARARETSTPATPPCGCPHSGGN